MVPGKLKKGEDMAFFNDGSVVIGEFQELEFKKYFEFKAADADSWGSKKGYPYQIAVGPLGETRFADIKKTVVYVVIDEDENGNPVTEKWAIKLVWKR